MPTPPLAQVRLYRAALDDVDALVQADLRRVWAGLDRASAAGVRDGLADTLPGIIRDYHPVTGAVAADWYDLMRAEAGVRGAFRAIVPDVPTGQRGVILARWAATPMFAALDAGDDPEAVADVVLSNAAGGLQRVIADAARETVTTSAVKDSARVGWLRVGAGACDWCQQYLDGEVHYTEGYDFLAHDRCGCTAVPSFD